MMFRLLAGSVAGALTLFMAGYVIFGILIASFMKEHTFQYAGLAKETPLLSAMFLSNLLMAFMLAVVLDHWASIRTFVGGLKCGATLGFLIALSIDVGELGYLNLYKGYALIPVDVLAETVRTALAGGVIGAVLGTMNRRAEA